MAWGAVELEPEVEKWLESLPTPQFAHAAFYVDLLAEHGPLLDEPHTKQLDRKLRELRFHLERRSGPDHLLDRGRPEDHPVDGFPQDAHAG
ncbi:type II toxin-antitoxin system RelE/ParE family toxin [Krasilnikovia cinnamomea]|uniref:type II toxin-antitoxin system RelE/ParE family toxin n=1 Tax=Krasilnikovia cinnamomea TaxID=349313 RepID=UPI001A913805|nr:type II toxin-antitoxin system RelE/ParE family toxin [Krasilnikovia cinnamomea]